MYQTGFPFLCVILDKYFCKMNSQTQSHHNESCFLITLATKLPSLEPRFTFYNPTRVVEIVVSRMNLPSYCLFTANGYVMMANLKSIMM